MILKFRDSKHPYGNRESSLNFLLFLTSTRGTCLVISQNHLQDSKDLMDFKIIQKNNFFYGLWPGMRVKTEMTQIITETTAKTVTRFASNKFLDPDQNVNMSYFSSFV